MTEDISAAGTVEHRIQCHAYPDRPGIALIKCGEHVLFKGEDSPVPVVSLEVRALLPHHIHFELPRYNLVWREG